MTGKKVHRLLGVPGTVEVIKSIFIHDLFDQYLCIEASHKSPLALDVALKDRSCLNAGMRTPRLLLLNYLALRISYTCTPSRFHRTVLGPEASSCWNNPMT